MRYTVHHSILGVRGGAFSHHRTIGPAREMARRRSSEFLGSVDVVAHRKDSYRSRGRSHPIENRLVVARFKRGTRTR